MILTDAQIREAFATIFSPDAAARSRGDFLAHYARAVLAADHANFYTLRPVSLLLIKKYNLAGTTEVTEHNFPSTPMKGKRA